MGRGARILTTDDVMPGVAKLVGVLQVEAMFPDGQKLVTIHDPIAPGKQAVEGVEPDEYELAEADVILNAGRRSTGSPCATSAIARYGWARTTTCSR